MEKPRTFTATGLKANTAYKCYVRGWTLENGTKTYISKSLLAHAPTGGTFDHSTNPASITVPQSQRNLKLSVGKKVILKPTVKGVDPYKKPLNHTERVRYISSNPNIADVSEKGMVVAVAKGSCDIYAVANNGLYVKVNVTVK